MDRNFTINSLITGYEKYVNNINASLYNELQSYSNSEFIEPLKYALYNGKRIRPLILILSAECIGIVNKEAYMAACAVELLHTESIIHDDIIDNEYGRRGKEPFHIKYGYNTSILTGDFVLGLILNISSKINDYVVTKNLASTAMLMSEGEMMENKLQTNEDITFDDYIKVIEYKTASVFEASSKIGAIIGHGNKDEINTMSEYGKNIGITYQIKDDLHDWNNEEKLFNVLIRNSTDPRNIFNHMENLLHIYSKKAAHNLSMFNESNAKGSLDNLIEFTKFNSRT